MAESLTPGSVKDPGNSNPGSNLLITPNDRAEIDISSPFESVREAATRFGGFGFWKPSHYKGNIEEADIMVVKSQAAELQNNLIVKERETLEVLKELETTKAKIKELNLKLQLKEEVHSSVKPAGLVLEDLNKAKKNLCKTTVDLARIRASVELLNKKLQEERDALEKTRQRLVQKSRMVETREKDREKNEQSEAMRATDEIARIREKIETANIRLVAARKMKEAVAIAEIKAETVTISAEDYATLTRNVREAEEEAKKRVEDAMSRVKEANVSKTETLKKADEAEQEIVIRKKALEKAVERVDTANAIKLELEEILRNRQRRGISSSVNNTSKFKNRRETSTTPRLMDVNGMSLTYDIVRKPSSSSVPVLRPAMSIRQILNKKLLIAEDVVSERKKMSLGQMLTKNGDGTMSRKSEGKENGKRSKTRKRKSFGFSKISVLLNGKEKKTKTKKKIALNLR